MRARGQRREDRGKGGGLRVPPAPLGAFRLRTRPPIDIQASPTTAWHIVEGFHTGLGGGNISWGRRWVAGRDTHSQRSRIVESCLESLSRKPSILPGAAWALAVSSLQIRYRTVVALNGGGRLQMNLGMEPKPQELLSEVYIGTVTPWDQGPRAALQGRAFSPRGFALPY